MNAWRIALSLALAAFVLWRNVPAALLCLFPRLMRARGEDESWPKVNRELFDRMQAELEPLGFRRLGVHVERPPLRRGVVAYDFVHEPERTWATAYVHGGEVRLLLLTAFDRGGFVLTGDHRMLNVDRPGCLAGGMPGAQPENLLGAHRRRIERLKTQGWTPLTDQSLDARVKAANAWLGGFGAHGVRLRNLNGLLLTALGLAVLGAVSWAMWRFAW